MSFPKDSAFAQALDVARKQPRFQTPEKIRADQDARREADTKVINIPTDVLEGWIRSIELIENGGDAVDVADRLRSYLR